MRWLTAGFVVITFATGGHAVVLNSDSVRVELSSAAKMTSLTAVGIERELARPGGACASARVGGQTIYADSLREEGNRLHLGFGNTDLKLTLTWEARGELLLVTLERIEGQAEEIAWLALQPVAGSQPVCTRRVLKYDDVSLALITEQPECLIRSNGGKNAYLTATSFRELKPAPARVALMAAPWDRLPDLIQQAEELFHIPLGIKAKRSDAARGSYLMISGISEENVELVTDWAQAGGFGSVLFLHGTWGHFGRRYAVPESTFPGGIAALRAAVDRMHQAGLLAGAHMFSSKIPKNAVWNQGKAERRLYQDKFLALGQPMDETADRIVTTEPPTDWPVLTGTRDLRIDDELVSYTDLSLQPPYGFTGVKRAQYGTVAQSHAAGTPVAHVVTDESRSIFIIDQNTDLIDQHAQDIADTYDAAGFDWIYFDGAEDVHEPRWFTTTNAMLKVIQRLNREPAMVQAASVAPFAWHLTTRVGQRDYFWFSESAKDEVDDAVARAVPYAQRELMVADLGWFPLRPGTEHLRGTQVDEVEYLCAKALGCGMTYSILTSVDDLRAIPALDAMLYIMKRYEHHKFAGTFDQQVRAQVLQPRQDFMLVELPGQQPQLVPAREMPYTAHTGHLVRAMIAEPVGGIRVVSLHPVGQRASIEFSVDRRSVEFTDYKGEPWPVEWLPGSRVRVPVTTRVLMLARAPVQDLRDELRRARAAIIKPPMIVVDAARPDRAQGELLTGQQAEITVPGAITDVLVPAVTLNTQTGPNHWVEYDIQVPQTGRYYLWIRAKYFDTNSNSFFLHNPRHPDQPINLGNRIGEYHHFIWDAKVPLDLQQGPFTLRVMGRESRPRESPLLDFIVLVYEDFNYVPEDADVRATLQ